MQQALPYRTWLPPSSTPATRPSAILEKSPIKVKEEQELILNGDQRDINSMVSENAVIIFGKRGCCMSHAMKRLLLMLGVNPAVYEVDEQDEFSVLTELTTITIEGEGDKSTKPQFPAVFIGGKLFGGLDRLMSAHISGELVPKLKKAGGLWL